MAANCPQDLSTTLTKNSYGKSNVAYTQLESYQMVATRIQ